MIVAGSRGVEGAEADKLVDIGMRSLAGRVTRVVSGCARGVDTAGERWAARHGVEVDRFPANWEREGRSAGFRRNERMAEHADALLAVWDGQSRGTQHMIEYARRKGLAVVIVKRDGSLTQE